MPKFELRKVQDGVGGEVDALFKIDDSGSEEEWCTVRDLDSLFETCVGRWGSNWNLEKVMIAIRESDID